MTTQLPTDAQAFAQFLNEQIANGGAEKSPEELLQIWRHEHAQTIDDIRQAHKNMEAGLGRPLREADAEIRAKYDIPTDA